ncbi:MAG: DUF3995 domain-containing protein [Hyphomicrobiales bacterium]
MEAIAVILFIIFLVLGIIHFYWLFGGNWGIDASLPTNEKGEKMLNPSKLTMLVVGLGLVIFGLFYLVIVNIINIPLPAIIVNYAKWIIPIIFLIRVVGDFNYSGFFKKVKDTRFAKSDRTIFMPLCFVLGILGIIHAILI